MILLLTSALAAPTLEVGPGCPGPTPIDITGLTPGATFAVVSGGGQGLADIPAGVCTNTTMDLQSPIALRHLATVPPSGQIHGIPGLPPQACEAWIQVIEMPSCSTSPAVPVSGTHVCPFGGASVLDNPDFESGTAPWGSDGVLSTTSERFAGTSSLEIDGNWSLSQTFAPVPVDDLTSATFWWWHWEDLSGGGSGVIFLEYADGASEVIFPPAHLLDGWELFDLQPYLDRGRELSGFSIYGGSTAPWPRSLVRFDNFSLCR